MTGRLFVHGKKQRARKVKRGKEDVSQADMPNQAREISQPCVEAGGSERRKKLRDGALESISG